MTIHFAAANLIVTFLVSFGEMSTVRKSALELMTFRAAFSNEEWQKAYGSPSVWQVEGKRRMNSKIDAKARFQAIPLRLSVVHPSVLGFLQNKLQEPAAVTSKARDRTLLVCWRHPDCPGKGWCDAGALADTSSYETTLFNCTTLPFAFDNTRTNRPRHQALMIEDVALLRSGEQRPLRPIPAHVPAGSSDTNTEGDHWRAYRVTVLMLPRTQTDTKLLSSLAPIDTDTSTSTTTKEGGNADPVWESHADILHSVTAGDDFSMVVIQWEAPTSDAKADQHHQAIQRLTALLKADRLNRKIDWYICANGADEVDFGSLAVAVRRTTNLAKQSTVASIALAAPTTEPRPQPIPTIQRAPLPPSPPPTTPNTEPVPPIPSETTKTSVETKSDKAPDNPTTAPVPPPVVDVKTKPQTRVSARLQRTASASTSVDVIPMERLLDQIDRASSQATNGTATSSTQPKSADTRIEVVIPVVKRNTQQHTNGVTTAAKKQDAPAMSSSRARTSRLLLPGALPRKTNGQ